MSLKKVQTTKTTFLKTRITRNLTITIRNTQDQGHITKVTGTECHAHAYLCLMGSPSTNWQYWHQQLGHRTVHKIPKVKVMAPRSKVT